MKKTFGEYTLDTVERSEISFGSNSYFGNITFANGFGASVVRHEFSYGNETGLYELAVLDESGHLCYTTGITDDVIGHLDKDGVERVLKSISEIGETSPYDVINMLTGLNATDITSDRQYKNGTMSLRFEIPLKFLTKNYNSKTVTIASYKSGYVRRLDNSRTPYQLNKQYKYEGKYGEMIGRIMLPNPIDRMALIVNYMVNNWR